MNISTIQLGVGICLYSAVGALRTELRGETDIWLVEGSYSHGLRCCNICFRGASMPSLGSPDLEAGAPLLPPLPGPPSPASGPVPVGLVLRPSIPATVPSEAVHNKRPHSSSTAAASNVLTTSKRRRDNTSMVASDGDNAIDNVSKRIHAGAHREAAIEALKEWCLEMVRGKYKLSSFSEECILSDDMLASLVRDATLNSVEAVTAKLVDPPWVFAPRHAQDVLAILARVDAEHFAARAAKGIRRSRAMDTNTTTTASEHDENVSPPTVDEDVSGPSIDYTSCLVSPRPRVRPRPRVYEPPAAPGRALTRMVYTCKCI